ncbi:unnamed protein product [Lactuca saligna]|uniref:Increased DNA methylation 1 C-terminal domain-containing protein n=1 Tax=Lactuca saligna TaxID=75948 RepID=A0AA36EEL4_LACSI|nr:unnamed protein product [Lactuca saligna]
MLDLSPNTFQCEREYHISRSREHKKIDLKELPIRNWFYSVDCGILNLVLERLVACGPVKVPNSLMGLITEKSMVYNANRISYSDVKWIVLRGKEVSNENKVLFSQAIGIFHADNGRFRLHTSTLCYVDNACKLCGSTVVTTGMFHVFGENVAELPIVDTNETNQGKVLQLFFNCFEKLLRYLKVKNMVVLAAEDVKSMLI